MEIIVIRSNRKTMTLSVNDELNAVVKAPLLTPKSVIDNFVQKHQSWLERAIENKKRALEKTNLSDEQISNLMILAKDVIPKKVEYYSNLMGLKPTGIKITKAKKRFGSCNQNNSLCFSVFLMQYPDYAIDYVVVHELAHIKHHNHSKDFYNLVEQYLPDYKDRERTLKKS